MNDPQMASLERCLPHLFLLFALDVPNSSQILSSVLPSLPADMKIERRSVSADHIDLFQETMKNIKLRLIGPRDIEVLKYSICFCFKRG